MDDKQSRTDRPTSLSIDQQRLGRMRSAVRLVRQETNNSRYTLRQLVEEAIDSWIRQIEENYNDGRQLRADDEPLNPGRMI